MQGGGGRGGGRWVGMQGGGGRGGGRWVGLGAGGGHVPPPRLTQLPLPSPPSLPPSLPPPPQIGTPVYMSPQLISAKAGADGYDATKADIWACGILLFVMLWGCFPYDHTEHPDPNSSDAHVEVREGRKRRADTSGNLSTFICGSLLRTGWLVSTPPDSTGLLPRSFSHLPASCVPVVFPPRSGCSRSSARGGTRPMWGTARAS